jgi:hypothetical protein
MQTSLVLPITHSSQAMVADRLMMTELSSRHANVAAIVTDLGYCKSTDGKMAI